MAEGILTRMKRILSGGVADCVDAIENAQGESVMRQTIREIDSAISEAKTEVSRVAAKRMYAARQITMIKEKLADYTAKAQAAVAENRNDIAEAVIARQLDLEGQIPVVEAGERAAQAEEGDLNQCLSALQARKAEMEASLKAYVESRREAVRETQIAAGDPVCAAGSRANKAAETFDRVMKNAGGVPSSAVAAGEAAGKLAELDAMMRQRKIAERLAALQPGAN